MTAVAQRALLTSEELAAFLKMPVRTVENWRYQRTGPAFLKVGRSVRYSPDAVEAWLQEQAS